MASKKKNLRLNSVSRGAEAVIYIVLGLFSLCCIIPFIFVVIISFSSEASIRQIGYSFIPMEWSTEAFRYAFKKLPQIWRSYFNSLFITVVGTALSTLMCALYSYVLYRPDFRFRRFFNFFSFFTMIFGGGLVPTYIICSQVLGLSENYGALIRPPAGEPLQYHHYADLLQELGASGAHRGRYHRRQRRVQHPLPGGRPPLPSQA